MRNSGKAGQVLCELTGFFYRNYNFYDVFDGKRLDR